MKKVMLLLLIVLVMFIVWNRERLYIRDPFGTVTRDGVKVRGVQVYINYPSDVLLENDEAPMYLTLVQHGQRLGTPVGLKCLHFVACRTDAAPVTLVPAGGDARVESMSSKLVSFRGGDGQDWSVTLY
jgi:hypothetical protein